MQTWTITEPFLPDLRCKLGEGPYYEPTTDSVRFVDIKSNVLHTVHLPSKTLTSVPASDRITVTANIAGVDPAETILVGAKYGPGKMNRVTGEITYVAPLTSERSERLRTNDGAVGPDGRFWLGYMTDFGYGEFQPEGGIVSYAAGKRESHLSDIPITIPNTIGWSPTLDTMYITHSSARTVYTFSYNAASHTYTDRRIFYTHPSSGGEPDGFRVDSEGNIWHAVYGDGQVLKLSPQGKVVGVVHVPTKNVTCVQFVGTQLFITTAADEESGNEESRKFGGAVFMVDVGATGLKPFEYKE
ncbi:hypothetical protein TD95_002434 [Thielaviopsis punctulata]|uniref:SMP-30/Gluconolactonase/LRE-like region domain-containing protein n=1 Tax=Thielaviopsis punctulata TaxID=72032 RepID=A0A0F4Z8L4_9PEZI|nr:hypothetical protein TD95_002434 [Thielaviopsis punctulata]